jgi:pSer/pThr/pTyr-binding forkhead associated (FHA) protein
VLRNEEDGATYPVQSRIVQLGRASEAQIRLRDETVSRVHAILRQLKTGEFEIENCSSNGTFVNHQKIDVATLVDGDLVSLGRITLRYAQRTLADAGLGTAPVANAS